MLNRLRRKTNANVNQTHVLFYVLFYVPPKTTFFIGCFFIKNHKILGYIKNLSHLYTTNNGKLNQNKNNE